jgi:hypothetical protein
MRWKVLAVLAAGVAASALATDRGAPAVRELSAAQIVERNVAARGGLEAWRKIQTVVWIGHMESAHAPVPGMLFTLQQKRPNKTRFEINALGDRTMRAFDGTRGWKLKPNRQGGPDVRPYTFEEVRFAHAAQLIDGPLIDYEAKGNTVTLEGLDDVEGHKAYHLGVRLPTGENDDIWVDAQTFLEIRYDRPSGSAAGRSTVSVFYRDYKTVEGLQIPFVIETGRGPGVISDKMVIERVMLNAPVDDRAFAPPRGHEPRGGVAMENQIRAPRRGIPLSPSGLPAPYPFKGQPPSEPASAPASGAELPVPAPAPDSTAAGAPGPASEPASGPTSRPN